MGHETLSELREQLGDVDFLQTIRCYIDENMDNFDVPDTLSLVDVVSGINDALLGVDFEDEEDED